MYWPAYRAKYVGLDNYKIDKIAAVNVISCNYRYIHTTSFSYTKIGSARLSDSDNRIPGTRFQKQVISHLTTARGNKRRELASRFAQQS